MEMSHSSTSVVSPSGRLTLGFQGKVIEVLPPPGFEQVATNATDATDATVCLDLIVYAPPIYHRYRHIIFFKMPQLPELRQLIGLAISRNGQSVIRGDDHEVFEFLTDQATSFLNELIARKPSALDDANALYTISAYLLVEEQAPTVDLMRLLRKVAYRNKEEEEELVTETSCPICLEDFVEGEEVHVTPCGHPFHLLCLERSLRRKQKCPLCRTDIPYRRRR